jgi:hypothetical protein
MADRIEQFEITTTAGVLSTAPTVTPLTMREGQVDRIDLVIPAGHAGLTGIALFHSGNQVIPYKAGAFFRGDDQVRSWPVARYPIGAAWTVRTFNTDVYDHTHMITLLITDVPDAGPLPLAPAPVVVTPEATPEEVEEAAQLPELDDAELAQLADQLAAP